MNPRSDLFGQPVKEFRGSALPEAATLAGYSALIERYDLAIPLPSYLAAIGVSRNPRSSESWKIVTGRQPLPAHLGGHLDFALKHEGVNLPVLSALFRVVSKKNLEDWIAATPGGANTRRI